MKDRKKQRANRKKKPKEPMLPKHSIFGYKDLTPYNAVMSIRTNGKAESVLQ